MPVVHNAAWAAWADASSSLHSYIDEAMTASIWDAWFTGFPKEQVRKSGAPHVWAKMSREDREKHEQREREHEERLRKQQEEYRARIAEEQRLREVAEKKAYDLLTRHLTPEQREEYERLQRFTVITKEGNLYRIKKGTHGNVELLKDEDGEGLRAVESLCVQPRGPMPHFDSMLAQKLHLETNEEETRRVANITNLRNYRRPDQQAGA